jgi:hypothetical protein
MALKTVLAVLVIAFEIRFGSRVRTNHSTLLSLKIVLAKPTFGLFVHLTRKMSPIQSGKVRVRSEVPASPI